MESIGKPNLSDDNNIKEDAASGDSKKETIDKVIDKYSKPINFIVIHNKIRYSVSMLPSSTIRQLKDKLFDIIGISSQVQKVMIKGLAKDDQTLESLNVNSSSEIMVVGAKIQDIIAIANVERPSTSESSASVKKEPLSRKKMHTKILDRGVPSDVTIGILNIKEPLPAYPLSGMLNKNGEKIRLTFKLELDELWIGTKDQTKKLSMTSIKNIVSEPIEGHLQYHIMGIQLDKTESSNYWVYWVPAQYVDSIKRVILGP